MKYIVGTVIYLIIAYKMGQTKDPCSGWNHHTFWEAVWGGTKMLAVTLLVITGLVVVSLLVGYSPWSNL